MKFILIVLFASFVGCSSLQTDSPKNSEGLFQCAYEIKKPGASIFEDAEECLGEKTVGLKAAQTKSKEACAQKKHATFSKCYEVIESDHGMAHLISVPKSVMDQL